jgi:hypothetical protein
MKYIIILSIILFSCSSEGLDETTPPNSIGGTYSLSSLTGLYITSDDDGTISSYIGDYTDVNITISFDDNYGCVNYRSSNYLFTHTKKGDTFTLEFEREFHYIQLWLQEFTVHQYGDVLILRSLYPKNEITMSFIRSKNN